jgi:hypothetical protein
VIDLDALAAEARAEIAKPGSKCWMCWTLPADQREWAERNRREGMSYSLIALVLLKAGHPKENVTRHRLEHHLREHVK